MLEGHKKARNDKAVVDADFEATTNNAYKQVLARIKANNAAIARGAPGEFGRTITVREIKAEVALHYLFNFNQRRFRDEVEHGVAAARAWCDANKIERVPQKGTKNTL